jgi:hypothetical protein
MITETEMGDQVLRVLANEHPKSATSWAVQEFGGAIHLRKYITFLGVVFRGI